MTDGDVLTKYAFDLDGTITKVETLPLLAAELGLSAEMELLTNLTLNGKISFEKSFKLRYLILRNIPPKKIVDIMNTVELDENILAFIKENKSQCAIVTGNLDYWVAPIIKKLGCESYTSTSVIDENGIPILTNILHKGTVIKKLKRYSEKVVAIGESFNDISMFEAADVAISYGGVHKPIDTAVAISDYVVFESGELCRLLKML